jgi:outer membrane protein assembly factor BamB
MAMIRSPIPQRRARAAISAAAAVALGVAAFALPAISRAASATNPASAASVYAYARGGAVSPSSCPHTTVTSGQCTLQQALDLVGAGGTVLLASAGAAYYGNFTIGTPGTSATEPVTVMPAAGVHAAVIDGDASGTVPCPTGACGGAVLTVQPDVFARVESVTITDGHNRGSQGGGGLDDLGTATLSGVTITDCSAQVGGAAAVGNGASLTVTGSTFTKDHSAYFGGAIDSGSVIAQVAGSGLLTVTGSTFSGDHSQRGGAIDTGNGGTGTATITRSVFRTDSASAHGGAIDNGDDGSGSLTITSSTFSGDTAVNGGAIDNADADGNSTLTVTASTFSSDTATDGGAVDNGARGTGTVTITSSTFYHDHAKARGSVIDTGDAGGTGSAVIVSSTIDDSLGVPAIGMIAGTLDIAGSILAGSSASCTRHISDDGFNLASSGSSNCGFSMASRDLVGVNPDLGKLRDNGGPTATIAPSAGSPVLEKIPNPGVASLSSGQPVALCPIRDQRGILANEAFGCAIGSVDTAGEVPVVTSLSSSLGPAAGGGTIVIHGGHFAAKAAVSFGTIRSPKVTVVSATQLKVTVPELPASDSALTVAVTVRNPAGPASPYRAAAIYRYYTPDWSAYLGGASHSSYNPAATSISSTSVSSLQPIWQWHPPSDLPNSASLGTTTEDASPVAYHGVIYAGLQDGYLNAVSEATGQSLWSNPPFLGIEQQTSCYQTLGLISTPTIAQDPVTGKPVLYVNGADGYLTALDPATGKVLWKSVVGIPSKALNDYYAWGSPTVANGKVYIGIASNCDIPQVRAGVLSFNQHTGKRIAYWDSLPAGAVGASVWSSVAVLPGGNVVATTGNGPGIGNIAHSESIVVLNGATLKLLGSYEAPQAQASGDSDFGGSPTIFTAYPNGMATTMIGACNKDGIYYAVRADDMAAGTLWTYQMGAPVSGSEPDECDAAAIWNGTDLIEGGGSPVTIDGNSYQGSVQALDPTTGQPVWQTGLPGFVVGSPSEDGAGVVAVPILVSPSGVSGVYLLSASTGAILKFISTEPDGLFAQPVFDGNDLLVGDRSSAMPLTAYAITTTSQSAPLGVSPSTVSAGTSVTLTLTATGGNGFESGANVIVSGAQVEVTSVVVDNSTTLTVQANVLTDAISGAALDVTVTNPDLSTYSCTQCLDVG